MSLIFYALEASELKSKYMDSGQILRFSAIECDDELNITMIHDLICKPRADINPDPIAINAFKIDLKEYLKKGMLEYEFAKSIHRIMSKPNVDYMGFQSSSYDDERLRRLFHRNLLNPYSPELAKGNSKYDLERSVSTVQALSPQTLPLPENLTRTRSVFPKTSFSDIESCQKLILHLEPDFIDFSLDQEDSWSLGKAKSIMQLYRHLLSKPISHKIHTLSIENRTKHMFLDSMKTESPLILSGYPAHMMSTAFPSKRNRVLMPLTTSSSPVGYYLIDLDDIDIPEQIDELLNTNLNDLNKGMRKGRGEFIMGTPVVHMKINKTPQLMDIKHLNEATLDRLNLLSADEYKKRASWVIEREYDIIKHLAQVEADTFNNKPNPYIDMELYGTPFISFKERDILDRIHNKPFSDWLDYINKSFPKESHAYNMAIEIAKVVIARNARGLLKEKTPDLYREWVQRVISISKNSYLMRHQKEFECRLFRLQTNRSKMDDNIMKGIELFEKKILTPTWNLMKRQAEEKEKAALIDPKYANVRDLVFNTEEPPF